MTSVSGFGASRAGSRAGANYWRIRSFAEDHPVLLFFAEERWRNLLIELPIYEFFAVRPLADAKVLATLDDENASPLLVDRRFDRGRVLLWTTSIDSQWTLFPEVPRSFVPLVHELLRYAAKEERPPRNVAPGEPLVAEVDAFPRRMELAFPDGTRRPLEGEPETVGPNRWRLPLVPGRETERVGLYRIELEGGRSLPFAVAIEPEEGDLERLSGPELEGLHDTLTAVAAASSSDGEGDGLADSGPAASGELWRWLALACLLALIAESLWAAWIGSRRSVR